MADNYYITINGEKIRVSKEVYVVYRQMRRQERTLAEKDSRNFVLKYEDFADGEVTGEEQIYDFLQPSVEELACSVHSRSPKANLSPQMSAGGSGKL